MIETGRRNASHGAAKFGFRDLSRVHWNLRRAAALRIRPALTAKRTSRRTGRWSPTPASTPAAAPRTSSSSATQRPSPIVWWDNNNAMTAAQFDALLEDFLAHARGKTLFAQDLYGGADPGLRVKARVFTELGWHSLFIRNLLIRPAVEDLASLRARPHHRRSADLPGRPGAPRLAGLDHHRLRLHARNRADRRHLLCRRDEEIGVHLPQLRAARPKHVMPMHCSANTNAAGETAIFFGLSGTGKTTLSADPDRMLIGDDEHGWSRNGVFNFEGGCYAKAIKLSREAEPQIYATTERFGTVMENVTLDPDTREPDFDDESRTENTRIAYPLDFIANASASGRAAHPEEHRHADLRRLRRAAADRQARSGAGDVSLPIRLHREGRGHREGRDRAAGDVLDLLRRAVPAAASDRLRQPAARLHGAPPRRLLARQHRLDRRQVRASAGACRSA